MTKEDFWRKWMPCDHPPIEPDAGTKAEFMADLQSLAPEAASVDGDAALLRRLTEDCFFVASRDGEVYYKFKSIASLTEILPELAADLKRYIERISQPQPDQDVDEAPVQ